MSKSKYIPGNFALRVGKSGTGKGLFALQEIPKGVCIIEYTGREISEAEQYTSRSKYLFEVGKNKMIDGNTKTNIAKYINHSCRPNCEPDGPYGRMFIFSKRKIKAGEELTYDYGKEYFNEHIKKKGCRCVKCAEKKNSAK